jgi:hypothetical protein
MTNHRASPPESLAENLASPGHACKIPSTHDRLWEAHYWWHEMARNYHEPMPFRYSLGAFIQAARNVTFMLQKEKGAFQDFSWYDEWVKAARSNPVLSWLQNIRTTFVHQGALEPNSTLEMRCVDNPSEFADSDEDPLHMKVSPFACTHYYMSRGPRESHAHEFLRSWEITGLDGREVLDACANVYDFLDALVDEAHRRVGGGMKAHRRNSRRALPCMEELGAHRVARTVVKDGREVWEGEPPGLHPD